MIMTVSQFICIITVNINRRRITSFCLETLRNRKVHILILTNVWLQMSYKYCLTINNATQNDITLALLKWRDMICFGVLNGTSDYVSFKGWKTSGHNNQSNILYRQHACEYCKDSHTSSKIMLKNNMFCSENYVHSFEKKTLKTAANNNVKTNWENKQIIFTPLYYLFKHWSRYLYCKRADATDFDSFTLRRRQNVLPGWYKLSHYVT